MTNFERAQKIVKSWPGSKTAPSRLRKLLDETKDPQVSRFVEALYAASSGPEDVQLIRDSFR